MKYLVSHQGEQVGPYTIEDIVQRVRTKQLDLFDYIYDSAKDDWILLMEHGPLAAKLKSTKPTARPPLVGTGTTGITATAQAAAAIAVKTAAGGEAEPAPAPSAHTISEWYILKGENRFGPFTYKDVVRMLQQKVVFPFDFVWHTGMDNWRRVAELAEFSQKNIRSLYSEDSGKDAFVQRRFKRRKFSGPVIVHDNMSLWRGQGVEISQGGVGVSMTNTMVLPGQQVTVHFRAQDGWPAFNAVCEVVSKKFVNDHSPVEYGLRFLSLSQEAQEEFYKRVA